MSLFKDQKVRVLAMNCKNNDVARHVRVRAVVAYPTASFALVVSFALALTSFGPSQTTAAAATSAPTATAAPITTTTSPTASADPITTTTAAPSVIITPAPVVTTAAVPTAIITSAPIPAPIPSPAPLTSTAPNGVPVDHHVLARIDDTELQANYLALDTPVRDAGQFQTFRVRFKFHNAGTAPITVAPQLEYRPDASKGFVVVPDKPQPGAPVYVTREWVPGLGLAGGTMQGPLGEDIAVGDLRTGNEGGGLAVTGHRSMGANPDQPITLPPGSYTEQEFTVTMSIDAQYLTGYELRITNAGTVLAGTQVATIHLGPPPVLQLSPDQHQGVAVGGPKPANRTGTVK
jgi:hypothetical protein